MPPKRPPPLPKSLFQGAGPLAPGSAPLPPEPTSIHPGTLVDAHCYPDSTRPRQPDELFDTLGADMPRPKLSGVVHVRVDTSSEGPQEIMGLEPFPIHPTILNLRLSTTPSIANVAKTAVDIVVPAIHQLTAAEWDLLEDAVVDLQKSWESAGLVSAMGETSLQSGASRSNGAGDPVSGGKIVISGLLPPPLGQPSSALIRDPGYEMYCGRLAQLSLQANVYLKALPPVIASADEQAWAGDRKEISRVLKMYLSPAIETFGTHRIIFGSSPALPTHQLAQTQPDAGRLDQPVPENEWYAVLRKAVTELGEVEDAVNGIFGANAQAVYGLHAGA